MGGGLPQPGRAQRAHGATRGNRRSDPVLPDEQARTRARHTHACCMQSANAVRRCSPPRPVALRDAACLECKPAALTRQSACTAEKPSLQRRSNSSSPPSASLIGEKLGQAARLFCLLLFWAQLPSKSVSTTTAAVGHIMLFRYYAEEAFSFMVCQHAPHAMRVLDMQDFHALRQGGVMSNQHSHILARKGGAAAWRTHHIYWLRRPGAGGQRQRHHSAADPGSPTVSIFVRHSVARAGCDPKVEMDVALIGPPPWSMTARASITASVRVRTQSVDLAHTSGRT